MPLTKHIQRQRDAIGAFLRDPYARVLSLRTAPELVGPIAKLIASFEKNRDLRAMFLPHPGPGDDATEYFDCWFSEVRADLETLGAAPIPAVDSTLGRGLRAAVWFETVAVTHASVARSVVLFLVTHPSMDEDLKQEIRVLASSLQSPRVRLIAVETEGHILTDEPATNCRLHVASLVATTADPRPLLSRFLQDPSARVLIVPEGAALLPPMLSSQPGVELEAHAIPYSGQLALESTLLESHAPIVAPELVHATDLEHIIQAASARRAARGAALLIIALDLRPHLQPDKVAAWVAEAASRATDPSVKFVIADGTGDAFTPHLDLQAPQVRVQNFSMGASDIEAGARDLAADASCEPERRFQALLALAGYAAGRQQLADAFRLCDDAGQIATARGLAVERGLVAVMRGGLHYRAGDFPGAIATYDAGLELATSDPSAAGLVPTMLLGLANAELRRGAHADAGQLYDAVAKLERQSGALIASLYADVWRGEALRRDGQNTLARATWESVLDGAARFGPDLDAARDGLRAEVLERLARLASSAGDGARAHRLHEQAGRCGCAIHVPDQP